MTLPDTLRALFDTQRRAWTRAELAAETGQSVTVLAPHLAALVEEGAVTQAYGRYRTSKVQPRSFQNGGRLTYDPEAERARIAAMLPATMAELQSRTGRSPGFLIPHLKALGAAPGAGWVWSLNPVGKPVNSHTLTLHTAGDEYACLESSVQRVLETVPTNEGFQCARRRIFVTFATCYDDYTTAAARQRGHVGVCRTCPKGQQLRDEYAQGA